jgi:hypothetical protein
MQERPSWWFGGIGGLGLVVSLLMVWAMEALQEAHLSLWLHIPLTVLVLTAFGLGAAAFGVTLVEAKAREH